MSKPGLLTMIALVTIVCGCSRSEETVSKLLQERTAGDYVVTLLNDGGELKTGSSDLMLEFRKSGNSELVDVGTVQVESTMPMPGMGPMVGSTSVTASKTPGRYQVTVDLSMMGDWKTVVRFAGGQQVQFNLSAR